jgi:hypothetical protein
MLSEGLGGEFHGATRQSGECAGGVRAEPCVCAESFEQV